MSRPTPAQDAWKTPEIREAESALDSTVSKSRELLKNLEKIRLKPLPQTDSPERIEALKLAAGKPDAPAALRLVKRKVDAGELSWQDVASGRAFADPEVRALADAKLGDAKDMYEEMQEGLSPEEVLEARTGSRDLLAESSRTTAQASVEEPKGFSNADPLASSSSAYDSRPSHDGPSPSGPSHSGSSHSGPSHSGPSHPAPAPGRHSAPRPDDDYTDPLADRGRPAPDPDQGRHSAPRHEEPRMRFTDPDDDYADPLTDRPTPKRPEPPTPRRPRGEDRSGGDDDYFGGSPLG
ncbi:hypothetical protein VSH64_00705 [Amycolatopsis rhabdoformis]|uniref:Uncharacterized protein n=1 Tax=Amycolatopsis rhabdoformis TaxID=1448059 RepID=A0ABZ1I8I2_9PSEU|nr:hypothetical protein [Amycolatopsis rhabdoformis]WSE30665.1 hypothetical protein VSH64_00705 [Amycolatopsis rhabdoformis]